MSNLISRRIKFASSLPLRFSTDTMPPSTSCAASCNNRVPKSSIWGITEACKKLSTPPFKRTFKASPSQVIKVVTLNFLSMRMTCSKNEGRDTLKFLAVVAALFYLPKLRNCIGTASVGFILPTMGGRWVCKE